MLLLLLCLVCGALGQQPKPFCNTTDDCSGNGVCLNMTSCQCYAGWVGDKCGSPDLTIYSDQGKFFIAWLVTMWVFTIPLAALFCIHNKEAPISGRHPALVTIAVVLFLVFVSVVLLERVYPLVYSCTGFVVTTILIFGMSLWVMFLRTWMVFFMFMSTAERSERKTQTDTRQVSTILGAKAGGAVKKVQNGWYVNHRWMARPVTINIAFVVGLAILLVTSIVLAVLSNSASDGTLDNCGARQAVFIVMGLLVILLGLAWVFFSIKLRRLANDAFFIKKELGMLALVCLIAAAIFLPLSTNETTRNLARNTFSIAALVCAITGVAVVMICLTYPLSKLHIPQGDEEIETRTFEEVIADRPYGREAFREFLVSEFSVENILVLDDIERFKLMANYLVGLESGSKGSFEKDGKQKPKSEQSGVSIIEAAKKSALALTRPTTADMEKEQKTAEEKELDLILQDIIKDGVDEKRLLSTAKDVYARYIMPGSPDQVNISSGVLNAVTVEMQNLRGSSALKDGTIFDEVVLEITSLCRKDNFPRFMRSKWGIEYKQRKGDKEIKRYRLGLVKHFLKLFTVFCLICVGTVGGVFGGGVQ